MVGFQRLKFETNEDLIMRVFSLFNKGTIFLTLINVCIIRFIPYSFKLNGHSYFFQFYLLLLSVFFFGNEMADKTLPLSDDPLVIMISYFVCSSFTKSLALCAGIVFFFFAVLIRVRCMEKSMRYSIYFNPN